MNPSRVAETIVAAWTRCYTSLTAAGPRTLRRAEIAADIHDHLADLDTRGASGRRAAWEILCRMAYGIPDDLSWALQPDPMEDPMNRSTHTLALTGWAVALILAVLNLTGAVAGLQDGWREIGQHWWSVLALGGIVAAIAGLALAVVHSTRRPAQ